MDDNDFAQAGKVLAESYGDDPRIREFLKGIAGVVSDLPPAPQTPQVNWPVVVALLSAWTLVALVLGFTVGRLA